MDSVWNFEPIAVSYCYFDSFPAFRNNDFDSGDLSVYALEKGEFEYRTADGGSGICREGELVLIPPGVRFTSRPLCPISLHLIRAGFEKSFPALAPAKIAYEKDSPLALSLAALKGLVSQDKYSIGHYRRHLICDVWYRIAARFSSPLVAYHSPTVDDLFPEAERTIRENLSITVASLTRHLGASKENLNKIFRKNAKKSCGQYITDCRMEKARELLLSGTLPLKSIAPLCGYSNEYYFSTAFKRHHGISPGAYRAAGNKE